jgi:multicomponent Na+:H+ antiporter subunit C
VIIDTARLLALVAATLVALGLAGVLIRDGLLVKLISVNVMTSGVFLLFGAVARGEPTDPVPHAMVLTGIVVSVAATALAVALIRRLHGLTGTDRLSGDER